MADRNRDTELVIRARNLASATFNQVADSVKRVSDALEDQASVANKAANNLDKDANALENLTSEYEELTRKANAAASAQVLFANDLANAEKVTKSQQKALDALTASAKRADEAAARAGNAVQNKRGQIALAAPETGGTAEGARARAAALREEADAITATAQARVAGVNAAIQQTKSLLQESAAASALRADMERLAATQAERNAQTIREEKLVSDAIAARMERERAAAMERAKFLEQQKAQSAADTARRQKAQRDAEYVQMYTRLLDEQEANVKKGGAAFALLTDRQREFLASTTSLTPPTLAFANAQTRVTKALEQQTRSTPKVFLGLRPYELQNLSYQLNDVFTQIASGTSVSQTLAQQGGQILQIFPQALSVLLRFFPVVLSVAAALALLTAAAARVSGPASALRELNALLAVNADSASYNAQQIVELQRVVEKFGVSADEAMKSFKAFIDVGLPQDQFERFTKAAEQLAKVTGKDVPDAAKQLAEGFTTGYDGIVKLDKAYNFLSASQLKHIKELAEQGDMAKATAEAEKILFDRLEASANAGESRWSKVWKDLVQTYRNLLDFLGNSIVITVATRAWDGFASVIALIAKYAKEATGWLRSLVTVSDVDKLAKIRQEIAEAQAAGPSDTSTPMRQQLQNRQDAHIAELRRQEKEITDRLAALTATPSAGSGAGGVERGLKGIQELNDALDDRIKRSKAVTNAQQLEIVRSDALLAAQKALGEAYKTAQGQAEAKAYVDKAVAAEQARINKEEEADRRRAAAAARTAMSDSNSRARLSLELRGMLLQSEKGITDDLEANIAARNDAIDRQFDTMLQKIAEFRQKGGTEIDGMSVRAFQSQVERNQAIQKDIAALDEYQKKAERAVQARNSIVESASRLVESGSISVVDLPKTIERAFAQSGETVAALVGKINNQIEVLGAEGAKSKAEVDALKASLNDMVTEQAIGRVNALQTAINNAIRNRDQFVSDIQSKADAGQIGQSRANEEIAAAFSRTEAIVSPIVDKMRTFLFELREAGVLLPEAFDRINTSLDVTKNKLNQGTAAAIKLTQGVRESVVNTLTEGFKALGVELFNVLSGVESVGQGLRNLGVTATQLFLQMLQQVATLIIQYEILAALGYSGAAAGYNGVAIAARAVGGNHGGGVAGDTPNMKRWFVPRAHSGEMGVGLKSDEVLRVLKRKEEVLSESDPANVLNGGLSRGKGSGAPGDISIRNVLVLDPKDILAAMQSSEGEKVTMATLSKNRPSIKKLLGNG